MHKELDADREVVVGQRFVGERALYRAEDTEFRQCVFDDGESPLKHARRVKVVESQFEWKYPLWHSADCEVRGSLLLEDARAGLWYCDGIMVVDSTIDAPKTFRRSRNIILDRVNIPMADETLWNCDLIRLRDVSARGSYFGMGSSEVEANGLRLSGNYAFDGARNLMIDDAIIVSRDAFWNCSDVTVRNSFISGEFLGWNSRRVTFENCVITSAQALCYIDELKLRGCRLINTDLAFEYSTVDAEIETSIASIKNPKGGRIRCLGYDRLTLDAGVVDPARTVVEIVDV